MAENEFLKKELFKLASFNIRSKICNNIRLQMAKKKAPKRTIMKKKVDGIKPGFFFIERAVYIEVAVLNVPSPQKISLVFCP